MIEGPNLVFLKNKLQRYKGKIVSEVSGEAELDYELLKNIQLFDIQSFGKNLLFVFSNFFLNIKVGSMGDILVKKKKKLNADLSLQFKEGEINFYQSEIKIYQGKPSDHFNFKKDILKPEFDADFILTEWQRNHSERVIGDVLFEQNSVVGIGAIIRTETLYHAKINPQSIIKAIPEKKLIFLLKMVVDYAEEFLSLLKTDEVEKNALIFAKKTCPKDRTPILNKEIGSAKIYVCAKCQKLFN